MDFVNDVTSTHQSVISRVLIRFLCQDVIHYVINWHSCGLPVMAIHRENRDIEYMHQNTPKIES